MKSVKLKSVNTVSSILSAVIILNCLILRMCDYFSTRPSVSVSVCLSVRRGVFLCYVNQTDGIYNTFIVVDRNGSFRAEQGRPTIVGKPSGVAVTSSALRNADDVGDDVRVAQVLMPSCDISSAYVRRNIEMLVWLPLRMWGFVVFAMKCSHAFVRDRRFYR